MKTKYIKVPVSERLPDTDGTYFAWIDQPNAVHKINPDDYNKVTRALINGEFNSFYDVTHCLIEVEDREDEMREMLEECLKSFNWISENCITPVFITQEEADKEIIHIAYRKQELEQLLNKQ